MTVRDFEVTNIRDLEEINIRDLKTEQKCDGQRFGQK